MSNLCGRKYQAQFRFHYWVGFNSILNIRLVQFGISKTIQNDDVIFGSICLSYTENISPVCGSVISTSSKVLAFYRILSSFVFMKMKGSHNFMLEKIFLSVKIRYRFPFQKRIQWNSTRKPKFSEKITAFKIISLKFIHITIDNEWLFLNCFPWNRILFYSYYRIRRISAHSRTFFKY